MYLILQMKKWEEIMTIIHSHKIKIKIKIIIQIKIKIIIQI
jgi:hypothetical protein